MPFDPRKPFDPSGIRLGTPAITTRGLREEHMPQIAAWMDEAITAAVKDDEPAIERIAGEVRDLLAASRCPAGRQTPDIYAKRKECATPDGRGTGRTGTDRGP